MILRTLSALLHLCERCCKTNWTHLSSSLWPHSTSSFASPRFSLSAPWLGVFLPPRSLTFRWRLVINSADRGSLWPKQIQSPGQVEGQGLFVERICFSLHQVSHILNVAYGVTNLYPDVFVYKTIQILDLPDTDITSYLAECSSFIDTARKQVHYTHRENDLLCFQLYCSVEILPRE